MDILFYCLIFIVGALVGFVITKKMSKEDLYCREKNNLQSENISLREEIAKSKAAFEQQKNQMKVEDEILELVKKEFAAIASKKLYEEQNELLEKNQSAVKVTLEPLNKQLEDFKKEISQYRESHAKNTGELTQRLNDLTEKSVTLSQTAQTLSDALTQNRNVKGWYGEDLARTILEKSGFQEGIHFSCQNVEATETDKVSDKIVRPDYEIFLPDNRNLVIDAKAILSSVMDLDGNDEEEKVKRIFSAVKARVKELADKKYQSIKGLRQPEFVLMYVPIEPIVNLLYTTKEGMEIVELSRKNKVVITGSVSLVTVINLIDWIWKENDRIQNLDEIIATGAKLYDAVAKHAEELCKIQRSISDVKDLTDSTLERLVKSPARINIFKEAEKLKDFGISSAKEIPEKLIAE
ncbi:DNA recombination protein RmuC [bacterium]|nr:DNA recombination protein RmuC [bacterium]